MRTLKILLVLLVAAAVYCGGGEKKPAAKTPDKTAKTTTPAAAVGAPANAAAEGFPPEAFTEITDAEMTKYTKALPAVGAALKAAGYKSEKKEGVSITKSVAATIEGMGKVAGVQDACVKNGMPWPEFRVTTFKVLSANMSLAVQMAMAMAEGMKDTTKGAKPKEETTEEKAMKAELTAAKKFFDGVPKKNQDMVFKNMDALKVLDDIE
jgi:hypothetical protein